MEREINYYEIRTLNYVLGFSDGMLVKKEKKEYIKLFEYLAKYLYAINNLDDCLQKESKQSDIIWQCWWQGEENMPNLVKTCTESVKKHNKNHKIVIIDSNNYKDYISLPDYITDKYEKGIITITQLSDIIRLMLLEKYGGAWIDSTILETDTLPPETFTREFFTYKNTLGLCFDKVKDMKDLEIMSNFLNRPMMLPSTWFISSFSKNIVISGWLRLLLEYWKYEEKLVDYFITDFFFVLLLLNNQICRQIFAEMPVYLTTYAEVLQSVMPEEFDAAIFEAVKSYSPIHKLTLKYTPDKSVPDRFYNRIIQ